MEAELLDSLALFDVVQVDVGDAFGVLMALTDGDEALALRLRHAGELDFVVREDDLLPVLRLGFLEDELVVEGEVGVASFGVPDEVVVDTTIAIISVDQFLLEEHVFAVASTFAEVEIVFILDF